VAVSVARLQVEEEQLQAQKALENRQRQTVREQESGQRRIEFLLVVVGTALALAELMDWNAAEAIYGVLSLEPQWKKIVVLSLRFAFIGIFLGLLWRFSSERWGGR
jgi:hypothetical protein